MKAEDGRLLSYSWDNFQNNLADVWRGLARQPQSANVTISAGGRTVRAHQLVLAAVSPFFRYAVNIQQHKNIGF